MSIESWLHLSKDVLDESACLIKEERISLVICDLLEIVELIGQLGVVGVIVEVDIQEGETAQNWVREVKGRTCADGVSLDRAEAIAGIEIST